MSAIDSARLPAVLLAALVLATAACAQGETRATRQKVRAERGEQRRAVPDSQPEGQPGGQPNTPSADAEAGILGNHVQLTFPDRFDRAGEAYFSPDGRKIIFQAVEVPAPGQSIERFYQMYVADLVRNPAGAVIGIENALRLSPPGSSNTCGWFHPTDRNTVIFGCTIIPPSNPQKTGYQREGKDYSWSFPREMDIVSCDLRSADGTAQTLERLVANPDAYLAECVISPDGRHLVYCERLTEDGSTGGDLKIMDLETRDTFSVTDSSGYDGGPFFSPDGRRLCYRSDRRGNDLLQVFVAELAFDAGGRLTGLDREFQLTDNAHVNWAPFWHPSGRYLIYTTSQMGHDNYEVFMLDSDPGDAGSPARYGTRKRRITNAAKFDGLPVFDADGGLMMWTSQRGAGGSSQIWLAEFLLELDGAGPDRAAALEPREEDPSEMHVEDPETGLFYIYDTETHQLSVYDPKTHEKRRVTDEAESAKARRLFNESGG